MGFALRLALAFGLSATLALQASPSLKTAASQGNLEAIKMNLAEGKNINEPDSNGWTPLMWAINNRQIAAADLLLNHGADPNLQATDSCKSYLKGATALILAAADGQEDAIKALHRKNAKIDLSDINGWTPLMWAVYY
ncbi:MAG: ankyrin repeat domain-containing protein, partial [Holophaga sp.]